MKRNSGSEPKFIGRKAQLAELRGFIQSSTPEFIAVYGRRRVGKTFLIREAVNNDFTFYFTAAHGVSKREQLTNFAIALRKYVGSDMIEVQDNWFLAFSGLRDYLDSLPESRQKVLFFDELPWADTPKSGFLAAFENFWNTYCADNPKIKLIVCGSATSWVINKIINSRGGLHGRITHQMVVEPFNLCETKEYFKAYGFKYTDIQLSEIYMIMGGIPYYFSLMDKGEGISKNIDRLFFARNAVLKDEFRKLYAALYRNPSLHLEIVGVLGEKGIGMTRQELLSKLKVADNGYFSTVLRELEDCGFIRTYLPFEKMAKSRGVRTPAKSLYQLVDLYSIFYLKFVTHNEYQDTDFWTSHYRDPELVAWRGIAFEKLCLWHIQQIKGALGISGIGCRVCSWVGKDEDGRKAQIDLLLDRRDGVVNICEMKYSASKFTISKRYADDMERKIEVFMNAVSCRKTPLVTFVTTEGVKQNSYSDLVQREVMLSALFAG